jgi:hypothetical protein
MKMGNIVPDQIDQIKQEILKIMYGGVSEDWNVTMLLDELETKYCIEEDDVQFCLDILCEEKFVTLDRKPSKKVAIGRQKPISRTYVTYRISQKGLNLINNDFRPKERVPVSPVVMVGEFNFGSITNIQIDINQVLDKVELEQTVREEIKRHFDELDEEMSKEKIDRSKVKEKLIAIASKGVDKITEVAMGVIIDKIMGGT